MTERLLIFEASTTPMMFTSPASTRTITEIVIISDRLFVFRPSTVPIMGERRKSVSPPLASVKQASRLKATNQPKPGPTSLPPHWYE